MVGSFPVVAHTSGACGEGEVIIGDRLRQCVAGGFTKQEVLPGVLNVPDRGGEMARQLILTSDCQA
jgi:hypothetical protein